MLAYDKRYLTSKASKSWQERVRGEQTFDLDAVSPYRFAARLSRPVLLAQGTADDNVPMRQYELMVAAAKPAPVPLTTLVIEGEGHSFSSAESEQKWYDALDTFLAKHNPADQIAPDGSFTPPRDPAKAGNGVPIDLPGAAGGK
jgi:dipeptidyl aminopeptidase/acylaminoacyl peptidase